MSSRSVAEVHQANLSICNILPSMICACIVINVMKPVHVKCISRILYKKHKRCDWKAAKDIHACNGISPTFAFAIHVLNPELPVQTSRFLRNVFFANSTF